MINPPILVKSTEVETYVRVVFPIGLAYLAGFLEREKYPVRIIDALAYAHRTPERIDEDMVHCGLPFTSIGAQISEWKPQLIGIPIFSTVLRHSAYKLIEYVHRHFPDIPLVVGGQHASVQPEECLTRAGIDYLCVGEGESVLLDLARSLERDPQCPNLDIAGLGYKKQDKVVLNPPRPHCTDLDSLPFPARHLLPLEEYHLAAKKCMAMNSLSTANKRWTSVVTSRGCPFSCVFCSIHLTAGKKWRPRSPENILDELEQLIRVDRIQHVAFIDDNMTLNRVRMDAILDGIEKRELHFEWSTPNGVRADTLSKELLVRMKRAGCQRICVAPESGNQDVVDHIIKKRQDLQHVVNVVKWSKEIKLLVDAFFVIGFPDETSDNVRETIAFAKRLKKLGLSGASIAVATPFYGTELYNTALRDNILNIDELSKLSVFEARTCLRLRHIQPEELVALKDEFLREVSGIPWDYMTVALRLLITNPSRGFRYATAFLGQSFHLFNRSTRSESGKKCSDREATST